MSERKIVFTEEQVGDIRMQYRQAKSPTAQIKILADLYSCDEDDIKKVLEIPIRTSRTYSAKEKEDILRTIREENLSLHDASVRFGVSSTSLSKWWRQEAQRPALVSAAPQAATVISPEEPDEQGCDAVCAEVLGDIRYGALFLDTDMCGDTADFLENMILRAMKVSDAFDSMEYLRNILNAAFVLKRCAENGEGLYPLKS